MSISPNNKSIDISQEVITEENTKWSNTNELDTVNHWLTCILPFVSKLQNEDDKARAIFFEKELKNKG